MLAFRRRTVSARDECERVRACARFVCDKCNSMSKAGGLHKRQGRTREVKLDIRLANSIVQLRDYIAKQ